jgi:methionine synthase II (cobalamin-independent)
VAAEALAAKTLATATAKATAGSTLVTANTARVASAIGVAQTQLTADLAAVISNRAAARAQEAWSVVPLSLSAAQAALDAASVTHAALVTSIQVQAAATAAATQVHIHMCTSLNISAYISIQVSMHLSAHLSIFLPMRDSVCVSLR